MNSEDTRCCQEIVMCGAGRSWKLAVVPRGQKCMRRRLSQWQVRGLGIGATGHGTKKSMEGQWAGVTKEARNIPGITEVVNKRCSATELYPCPGKLKVR